MKILIIENDEHFQNLLKKNFESHGFTAEIAKTREEGIKYIENNEEINLIILDLFSEEGISAEVFCKKIKSTNLNLPILVLSKEYEMVDVMKVLENGADDYLVKPFSIDELISKAEGMLMVKKENNEETKDEKNEVVIEDIHLTPKEEAIFNFLAHHPNEVLSRDTIFENVWTFDSRSISNVIDVHMKNLRKKFKRSGKKNVIETVWGLGYRFSR